MEKEIHYKRQMDRNYMVIKGEEGQMQPGYEMRMIAENEIQGFMKLHIVLVDCLLEYYYDISSMQPLSRLYQKRKMGIEEIRMLFFSLQRQMEQMIPYLLECSHLVLEPAYIYVQPQSFQLRFCYHTDIQQDFHQSLQDLMQFILEKLNHEDSNGVMAVYQMYQRSLEDCVTVEELLKILIETGEQTNEREEEENDAAIASEHDQTEYEGKDNTEEMGAIWQGEMVNPLSRRADDGQIIWRCEGTKKQIGILIFSLLLLMVTIVWFTLRGMWNRADRFIEFLGGAAIVILYNIWNVQQIRKKRNAFAEGWSDNSSKVPKLLEVSSEEENEARYERKKEENVRMNAQQGMTGPLQRKKEHVLISQNPGRWNHIQLTQYPYTVGRTPDSCNMILDFPEISRLHGEFQKREDEIWLMDLNSSNGTYVNEIRLEANTPVPIRPGDRICFACIDYIFN